MKSFNEMPIPMVLKKSLKEQKFIIPTEIQAVAVPLILSGVDLVACAQTGSGKTLAYSIPLFARLVQNPSDGALILAPTRELAKQISDVIRGFTKELKNLKMSVLVGGTDIRKQMKSLKRKPQIIVATPGRLTDHLYRKSLNLNNVKYVVLDEGDRMLDMGFSPQIDELFKFLPRKKQVSLFSATLPNKLKGIVDNYMFSPQEIAVGPKSQPISLIKQKAIYTTKENKEDLLIDELNSRKGPVIVFTRTREGTDVLSKSLQGIGFSVSVIHGARSQGQRNQALRKFKEGKHRILCATDVAARGIDIPTVKHVINYDLPPMDEDYVHRIGRTARNGATGEALSLLVPNDYYAWLKLQKKYKTPAPEPTDDPEIVAALKRSIKRSSSKPRSKRTAVRGKARKNTRAAKPHSRKRN